DDPGVVSDVDAGAVFTDGAARDGGAKGGDDSVGRVGSSGAAGDRAAAAGADAVGVGVGRAIDHRAAGRGGDADAPVVEGGTAADGAADVRHDAIEAVFR